jgi:hypothetical protein
MRGIPICSFDLYTGQIIKIYAKQVDVEKDGFNPRQVSQVISGKGNSHKKFGWRYLRISEIKRYKIK